MCQRWKDSICAGRLLNLPGLLSLPPLYPHFEDRGFSVWYQKQTLYQVHRACLAGTGTRCAAEVPSHGSPSRTVTVLEEHLSQLPASSIWAELWPAALNGVLEIHRLHCEKMPTAFPRKCRYGCSGLSSFHAHHAQPSAPCRHG